MQGSVLTDKSKEPCGKDITRVLGPVREVWDELIAHLALEHPGLKPEWKFYGQKQGWQLKYMKGKKAAMWVVPHEGSFLCGMALRPPGVELVKSSDLPKELIEEIAGAKKFMEGAPARVTVKRLESLELVKQLLAIKIQTM